jgi:hypothetical protein
MITVIDSLDRRIEVEPGEEGVQLISVRPDAAGGLIH